MNMLYKQLLLFPERAENLGQFATYDVDLEHWKSLSAVFRDKFRSVYERGTSAILLVHGAQGTGKTLFSRRLSEDFARSEKEAEPDRNNLWHALVGEDAAPVRATIATATAGSALRRVEPTSDWLKDERAFAKSNKQRVRIFVIDDAQKDVFLREWAGLTQGEYLGLKAQKNEAVALDSVASKLVEDCRNDFSRSIFLLLSHDSDLMEALKAAVDRSHVGLATVLALPLPDPATKERIIRKNTNRLNRVSYWYCLDAADKNERLGVYDVLTDANKGFTAAFSAVDKGLRRSGRPANRNQITLVTLGTPPDAVRAFIDDANLAPEEHYRGDHLGVWWMREEWASVLYEGNDTEQSRRAAMVESEFALRWVALDMKATQILCQVAKPADCGEGLLDLIKFTPSIGKPAKVESHAKRAKQLDDQIQNAPVPDVTELAAFAKTFGSLGQRRSTLYEPAIGARLPGYSHGFSVFPTLKPDFIAAEYKLCAVSAATVRESNAITEAIRRTGHAIEFTAHLRDEMAGLKEYLLGKVVRYAALLESV